MITQLRVKVTVLVLSFLGGAAGTAAAEIRMKYPMQNSDNYDEWTWSQSKHWGCLEAVDIPVPPSAMLFAPISGNLVFVEEGQADNQLGKTELLNLYDEGGCTPLEWGYGNYIKIESFDGEVTVLMAHLRKDSVLPEQGAVVNAGDPVAVMGSSGFVCPSGDETKGTHVHIEYRDSEGVKHFPQSKFCSPLVYPSDEPGECNVGIPPGDCEDGIQNQGELGLDCGGPCPPCEPPDPDPPPCNAEYHWEPNQVSMISETGLQANGTIPVALRVEVQEQGVLLETRVCKVEGTFNEDLATSVYDVNPSAVGLHFANLSAQGMSCSEWREIGNIDLYGDEGDSITVAWEIFSPWTSAWTWSDGGWPNWPRPLDCKKEGNNPTGTCWHGVGPTITRTCLP